METNQTTGFFKQRKNIIALIVIGILIIIAFCMGFNCQIEKTVMEETTLKNEEYEKLTLDVSKLREELGENKTTLSEQATLISEMEEYKKIKNQKTAKITELDNQIISKTNTLSTLNNDIATKENELSLLKAEIQTTGEAPKVLGAGHYTVGADIPAGRYVVTGKSNFVVRSLTGSLKVNTILGGGNWGVESYTCELNNGDILELSSKDTFTPVK